MPTQNSTILQELQYAAWCSNSKVDNLRFKATLCDQSGTTATTYKSYIILCATTHTTATPSLGLISKEAGMLCQWVASLTRPYAKYSAEEIISCPQYISNDQLLTTYRQSSVAHNTRQ
ncbi:hypothetical protein P5673_019558 [Acropora cervicornis]|uniref:Uncharacterized protein n=1 Tax=Acropora cervicornis TaxID=6130 RepID=A0AAD9V257_ACRCE|nr:hypothetical protein P5673_019558 [Acropora cervicornis]